MVLGLKNILILILSKLWRLLWKIVSVLAPIFHDHSLQSSPVIVLQSSSIGFQHCLFGNKVLVRFGVLNSRTSCG